MAGTYTELLAEIKAWLHRGGNIDVRLPDLVRLAEVEFNRKLRVRQMEARYVYDGAAGERYISLPGDYLSVRNVQINAEREIALKYLAPDVIDEDYNSSMKGRPAAYTVIGNQFQFAPSPDGDYQYEIAYYKKIPRLSQSNQTNWLLTDHEDLYLYGALIHAGTYVKDYSQIAGWRGWINDQLEQIKLEDRKARFPDTPLRARIPTSHP